MIMKRKEHVPWWFYIVWTILAPFMVVMLLAFVIIALAFNIVYLVFHKIRKFVHSLDEV